MIELPLTPFFFRKLGIYQELTDKELVVNKKLWKMEKALLKWTVKHHHHLASTLSRQYVRDRLKELGFSSKEAENFTPKVMGNLCQKGYAVPINVDWIKVKEGFAGGEAHKEIKEISLVAVDSPAEIVFTPDGLIAGRVLMEIETWWGKCKYKGFILLLWLTLVVLFIKIIASPIIRWGSMIAKMIFGKL